MTLQILTTDTRKRLELPSMIDSKTGCDYARDFIGNAGGFENGSIRYSHEDDAYLCDQDTYDWWLSVMVDMIEAEAEIESMRGIHGEEVDEVIRGINYNDLADLPYEIRAALKEAYGEEA